MKSETLYDLQKIWSQVKIADLLSEGESGRRQIHLSSLDIRNQLLQCIETYFSANISLLFKQTQWTKYFYSEEDTDIVFALKTIFNLLYQIHQANALDRGVNRHLNWPLQEILELNRHKSLLVSLLPNSITQDLFNYLSFYWPNSDKIVYSEDEKNIESGWLVLPKSVHQDHFVTEESVPKSKTKEKLGLKEIIYLYKEDESLDNKYEYLNKSLIFEEDYIASHLTNFLRSERAFDRVQHLIDIYRKRLWEQDALEKSLIISELAKFIRDCFFYFDYLEARIDAPGLFSQRLTEKLHSILETDKAQFFFGPLKAQLSIDHGKFFIHDRLQKAKERQREIKKYVKDTLNENKDPVIKHKINGLKKAYANLDKLQAHLTLDELQSLNLQHSYLQCKKAVAKLIDFFKEKFPHVHKNIILQLHNLQGNLALLLEIDSDSDSEKPKKIISEYLHLKSAYLRLTRQIPKTCGVYLQPDLSILEEQFHRWVKNSESLTQIYQEAEQSEKLRNKKELESTLELIRSDVALLDQEIQKPKKVNWWWPIVSNHPMSEEVKTDYCDKLLYLEDAILKYIKTPSAEAMKRIANLIFDLQRLERNRGELNRNSDFKKIWNSINEQIEVLKARDLFFNRYILTHEPVEIIEDKGWCEYLNLETPLPPLPSPTKKQIIKYLNDMAKKMRDQIMQVINNQAKDSELSRELACGVNGFYYDALKQGTWQEYTLTETETTETYTIKLLLNILYKIHQATHEGIYRDKESHSIISPKHISDWVRRLIKLPVFEISRLVSELPSFLSSSGLEGLGNDIINIINVIKSLADENNSELIKIAKVTLDMNQNTTATPFNALAHSGLIGTDLPQIMLLLSSGQKIYSKSGIIKNASRIVNPNWQKFRDENAVAEIGRILLNSLSTLDNFAAKTGLNEHKIPLTRVIKTAVLKAREVDEFFKDELCQKHWEIAQGQPFLIKRMKSQEAVLSKLTQEFEDLKKKNPPECISTLLNAMRTTDYVDLEDLELKHGNELKQFLWSHLSQKEAEIQIVLKKMATTHEEKLKKMLVAGESEHNIEKEKLNQLSQLQRYEAQLAASTHFNLKNIDELFKTLQNPSVMDEFRLPNMAAELEENIQTHKRILSSKAQHIKQVEHALIEKKSLVLKELVEQMDALTKLAYQLQKNSKSGTGYKIINLFRSLFHLKTIKNHYMQLEADLSKVEELYSLTYEASLFKTSIALHRDMLELTKVVTSLPGANSAIKKLAESLQQKATDRLKSLGVVEKKNVNVINPNNGSGFFYKQNIISNLANRIFSYSIQNRRI